MPWLSRRAMGLRTHRCGELCSPIEPPELDERFKPDRLEKIVCDQEEDS
jgi:hypothetical protein